MNIIESTKELESFCKKMKKQKFITVDLEFMREKTYYAKLCLIQIGSLDECAIIDPLASGINLSAFFSLLENKKILKVFHSCRQDIEILYMLTGKIPKPLFDTQIAAMVCGFGESVSYENLVNKILNKEIDKTSRLSNWEKRPLSNKQFKYAMSDVTHLVHIYLNLQNILEDKNRESWVAEEIEILNNPSTYTINSLEVWHKIKHRSHNRKFLTMVQQLAAWREEKAQKKDVLRQSIIRDDCLLNIATTAPDSIEQLSEVRGIRRDILSGKLANEILEVIINAKKILPIDYVDLHKDKDNISFSQPLLELLKLLLKIVSIEEGVVARLIASEDDLKSFAAREDEENQILEGWRNEIFGKKGIRLREGITSIKYNTETQRIELYEAL